MKKTQKLQTPLLKPALSICDVGPSISVSVISGLGIFSFTLESQIIFSERTRALLVRVRMERY